MIGAAVYKTRALETIVQRTIASFPCVAIYGPRQVGKSTMLRHMYPNMHYVTLDNADDRALAKENPRLFLQANPWPIIIDEIQKAPNLMEEIKIAIDNQRLAWLESNDSRQVMYLLTGSSQFELREAVSDSLAGRVGELELSSFSRSEINERESYPFNPDIAALQLAQSRMGDAAMTRAEIFEAIFMGGMPDLITGVSQRDVYFPSCVSTYIERDVRSLIVDGMFKI